MKTSNSSEINIRRGLLTFFLILVSVILVWFGFSRNMPLVGLLIPFIAIANGLISRPVFLFTLVLFCAKARLMIPGLPGLLGVSELFQILLIGWTLLDIAIRHQKRPNSFCRNPDIWLMFFLLNTMLIMSVRGSGFALLGSRTYGGTGYLAIFLSIVFYFSVIRIRLVDKQVKILLWILLAGTLVPALVQFLSSHFPSGLAWTMAFVQANIEQVAQEQITEGGFARWNTLSMVSYALIPIAYLLIRLKNIRFIFFILIFLLVGLAGFRSRIVQAGAAVFFVGLYFSKNRMRTLMGWALAGVLAFGVLMIMTPMLPPAVQRSLSFIPFLAVDFDVAKAATGSSSWRFDLWRDYCLPNVPQYLLIGRGVAQDISQFAWLQSGWYEGAEFFYYMGRYHSGPFSLLLDFGLAGTISFTWFFLAVIIDGWKTTRRYAVHQNSLAARYYAFLTIWMSIEVFAYYFIFGDVRANLFSMLMIAAQLRILKKNFLMESPPEAGMPEVRSRVSGVRGPNNHQQTTSTQTPVNRWAVRRIGVNASFK